jgi:phage baseplate assembly protein V
MGGELYHDDREHYHTGGVLSFLRNMIRIGNVVDRRNKELTDGNWGAQVKSTWTDKGDNNGVVSGFLTVIQQGSMGSKKFFCPRAGDQIISLHDPDAPEHGFVIGTLPTTSNPHAQKPSSLNSELTTYDDGARLEYDPDAKKHSFYTPGEMNFTADTTIKITAKGDITITSQTKITANGVIIDKDGNVTMPKNCTIQGNLTVAGSTQVQDINIAGSESGGGTI